MPPLCRLYKGQRNWLNDAGGRVWVPGCHRRGRLVSRDNRAPAPTSREGRDSTSPALFHAASFANDASFQSCRFAQGLSFDGVRVQGRTFFRAVRDSNGSDLLVGESVAFDGPSTFRGCRFQGEVFFSDAVFKVWSTFRGSIFESTAMFVNAIFEGWGGFSGTRFSQGANFEGATFKQRALFADAEVRGETRFVGATFEDLVLREASFRGLVFREQMERRNRRSKHRQIAKTLDMHGCTYTRIYATLPQPQRAMIAWEGAEAERLRGLRTDPDEKRRASAPPGDFDVHERQQFVQLETTLRAMGRHDEADDVYVGLRHFELRRKLRWNRPHRWLSALTDVAYWGIARYGLDARMLLVFLFATIALGTFVFSLPNAVASRQTQAGVTSPPTDITWHEAMAVSLNMMIPVETPWGSGYRPSEAEMMQGATPRCPGSVLGVRHPASAGRLGLRTVERRGLYRLPQS
jgi:uncharacterized protein YjbI with pentapeptide repeats